MSLQRRRGQPITLYPVKQTRNRRGDLVELADRENPWHTRCAENADRSSRMEVPGQQEIDVISVRVGMGRPVSLFGRAEYQGDFWDVTAPPARRNGPRAIRHQTVLLRRRPGGGGLD